jgi:hypothetical protein
MQIKFSDGSQVCAFGLGASYARLSPSLANEMLVWSSSISRWIT